MKSSKPIIVVWCDSSEQRQQVKTMAQRAGLPTYRFVLQGLFAGEQAATLQRLHQNRLALSKFSWYLGKLVEELKHPSGVIVNREYFIEFAQEVRRQLIYLPLEEFLPGVIEDRLRHFPS